MHFDHCALDGSASNAGGPAMPHVKPAGGLRHGAYEVHIPQGLHRSSGHVEVSHGARYSIRLHNRSPGRCDARVEIDGHRVGVWRIPAFSMIEVERPVNDTGYFTFFRLLSEEGQQLGLQDNDDLGLIRVEFLPECDPRPIREYLDVWTMASAKRGGTGLTGFSRQTFVEAESIQHDLSAASVIHLRLIALIAPVSPLCRMSVRPHVLW